MKEDRKNKIDELFIEKKEKTETHVPDEVVEALKMIAEKNDSLGIGSPLRVSASAAISFIKKEFSYSIGHKKLADIMRSVGRRSWARA